MDWTIYLIPLATVLAMFIANAALIIPLFLWNRSEANADRRDMAIIIKDIHKEIKEEIHAIHLEIKDFHGRLCKIEAERK